jgi:DNA-binding SARP family transcriptional activator/tetratricopeptide (TPR) repeat protein
MGVGDDHALRLQVLGPLRARRDGSTVALGPVQRRVVLAVLALRADRPIGRDQLIDAVWGTAPPGRAVNLVQRHVSALRRVLWPAGSVPDGLVWTDAGYRLAVPAGTLDLSQFDDLLASARAARAAGDLPAAAEALHTALGLWRGPVCDGLRSPFLDVERARLAERRTGVLEDRIELDLALGRDLDLVDELRTLVADHPTRERLRGLLMRALYRGARPAEALAAYQEARGYLREEFGVDPSPQLRLLQQQILTADPALAAGVGQAAPVGPDTARLPSAGSAWSRRASDRAGPIVQGPADPVPPVPVTTGPAARPAELRQPAVLPVPAQLPHRLGDFVGREAELDRLDAALRVDPATGDDESCGPIICVAGTAGVGKTTLAVQWAHRVRGRYPDGQLYVDLHGFDPHAPPAEPAAVIRGFLDALGMAPDRIPVEVAGQAGLYRSLLADRRVLVVLDNARDAVQVRPLLPGSTGCPVLVTSRNQLVSLIVTDGARPVPVDLMPTRAARALLARRLGRDRVTAEPAAVDDIILACARLPLALSIVAARAATNPDFSLEALAGELRAAHGSLDAFDAGEHATDVRAVFSWSYTGLPEPAARLFRLLWLAPGPDISITAAAALGGVPVSAARVALTELGRANLMLERRPGRFTLHDLLRTYAGELTAALDPAEERRRAATRVLDHYLHTAHRADQLINPYRDDPIELPVGAAAVVLGNLAGRQAALAWFTDEQANLIAAVRWAAGDGFDAHAWRLAWTLTSYLDRRGHWHESAVVQQTGLDAARRVADRRGEATCNLGLAHACTRQRRHDAACAHAEQALAGYAGLGDRIGMAHAHHALAFDLDRRGRYADALAQARQELELYVAAGHRTGEGRARNAVGWFHFALGQHEEALRECTAALELQRAAGARYDQADTLDSLARANYALGRYGPAIDRCGEALELHREFGQHYDEGDELVLLGDIRLASGQPEPARDAWKQALVILDQLGDPDADSVRVRLGRPNSSTVD